MRATTLLAVVFLPLALGGCRLNIERIRDGVVPDAEKVRALSLGETTLAQALAAFGAPDGLEWYLDDDALLYDHVTTRRSHLEVESPLTYAQGVTPQQAIGEAATYVFFVAGRTGRNVSFVTSARSGTPVTTKPLQLDGDEVGRERLRLFFRRDTTVLVRAEITRASPGAGASGAAASVFLK